MRKAWVIAMWRVSAALATLLVAALVGDLRVTLPRSAPSGPRPKRAGVEYVPGPKVEVEIPVAPPPGAGPTDAAITPFTRVGSPAVRMKIATYAVPMTPHEIYDYYRPRLVALGYARRIKGSSCARGRACASDWGFTRGNWFSGRWAEVDLTVEPTGARSSVYSIQMQSLVMPKPRIPERYQRARPDELQAGAYDIRNRKLVERIYRALLALPLVPPGAYSCPDDFGQYLGLRFLQRGRTVLTATWKPAGCRWITVGGLKGARAADPSFTKLLREAGIDLGGQ